MKIKLLLFLLIIPFLGISQTKKPIEGVLGIKLGTSRADAVKILTERGATLSKENSDKDALAASNVTLGSRKATVVFISLYHDKVYQILLWFSPGDEPKIIDYYNDMVKDFTDIYGNGAVYNNFKSPYKFGDGDEVDAIKGGYATMLTSWDSDKKGIQISIIKNEDELYTSVVYADEILYAQREAEKKAAQKSDY